MNVTHNGFVVMYEPTSSGRLAREPRYALAKAKMQMRDRLTRAGQGQADQQDGESESLGHLETAATHNVEAFQTLKRTLRAE